MNTKLTWYGDKELHCIFMSMKAQLSLRYVAVWNEASRKYYVCRHIAIDSHNAIRFHTS